MPASTPQVIESYLLDKYRGHGPDLLPRTPEARARAALATRILDLYITPIQGCMYKQMGAAERAEQLARVAFQLNVLEDVVDVEGPFVAGVRRSAALRCVGGLSCRWVGGVLICDAGSRQELVCVCVCVGGGG
jgi:glutathione S-transferase